MHKTKYIRNKALLRGAQAAGALRCNDVNITVLRRWTAEINTLLFISVSYLESESCERPVPASGAATNYLLLSHQTAELIPEDLRSRKPHRFLVTSQGYVAWVKYRQ